MDSEGVHNWLSNTASPHAGPGGPDTHSPSSTALSEEWVTVIDISSTSQGCYLGFDRNNRLIDLRARYQYPAHPAPPSPVPASSVSSPTMNALIDDAALLDDDDDDVSFDEETGEPTRGRENGANGENGFDDSSEEEEDDDEEEAQRIRKDFIVDEDEDDAEEARRKRRREKRKRPREDREEDDLDEEDLELIGIKPQREESQSKFKRLKRGPRRDEDGARGGVDDIFADELEEQEERRPRGLNDEFDDFIEDDVFSDEEGQREREDLEVARPSRRTGLDLPVDISDLNIDGAALEDFKAAFGDGTEYDFALEQEDIWEQKQAEQDRHLILDDVFEPQQLKEKLLTEEDNLIRFTDVPERFQLARKPYAGLELTEDEFKEEAQWISQFLLPSQQNRLSPRLYEPFTRSVLQALEFMINEQYEVPFIANNRKDYFIHVETHGSGQKEEAVQLLRPKELWSIFELDLKFRALIERRRGLQKTYDELKSTNIAPDDLFETMVPKAVTLEELSDLYDYLYFQYSSQIKDLALTSNGDANGVVLSQKKANTKSIYETIRQSRAQGMVRGYGMKGDDFAKNVAREGVTTYADDPSDSPANLADTLIDETFADGNAVLRAGRNLFVEEIVTNPRFRKYLRAQIYSKGVFDCYRTDRGLRKIDESHPYYEFKYLRNQTFASFIGSPSLFLRMLKAEEEGMIEVKVRINNADSLKRDLAAHMKTDNYSDVADAWNKEREKVVAQAFDKTMHILGRIVKETFKSDCEDRLAEECREEFDARLDQAPYQPEDMHKGTTPRCMALSIGRGIPGKDPVHWVVVGDDGRASEYGTFVELAPADSERAIPEGKDVAALIDVIQARDVEVLGVSGFTPETRKLVSYLNTMVEAHKLQHGGANNTDDDRERRYPDRRLEVIIVNDEVARLYHTSQRARNDHPAWNPLTHYCFALARYLQDPMKEYASLGNDIISLNFHRSQSLLPEEKLMQKLEMALVDKVNLVGVDVNEAAADPQIANLLPYVCGLGPRKAQHVLRVVSVAGGFVNTREGLLVNDKGTAMTLKVWNNAASTLNISFDESVDDSEFLDSTRIHPEDYDIARKMAADALELDEEDIEAERQKNGSGAIMKLLVKGNQQDRVNDLVLEEYAIQLERNLNAKKRSTLETIRAELIEPFEELRREYEMKLREEDIFTMFTGETSDSSKSA
ncbi:Transcription elongation factor spt6 [Cyphellophora attinorum]|uniref:Transcription elongation factor spt6 n=1 Tax=Cyphellophora attinorum TaxID=1664694 RepID=A0A0N0NIH5_9EURO|nr:Transcription elongation factor spt6 [Phialophora attinorum]KPI35748.1 Transcription elongation factor spt6 [Phialophora attinorum]